mgnify:FL=1
MTRAPSGPSGFSRLRRGGAAVAVALAALLLAWPAAAARAAAPAALTASYDRLLPLEGGSNFRDLGGYFTADGHRVRRGMVFRSGVMTGLTAADQDYLAGFGFRRVVDLRSSEERDLYPNHWARAQGIEVAAHDYSIAEVVARMVDEDGEVRGMAALYTAFPDQLEPQLRRFFDELLAANVPLVVNCSAGQDRTGLTAALFLLALGVPRAVVIQDYLLSTRYRRPQIERGDVDLAAAAQSNAFARLMLRYREEGGARQPQPLLTAQGVPYLRFALDRIEQEFGSVAAYLEARLGVDGAALAELRERFLVAGYARP